MVLVVAGGWTRVRVWWSFPATMAVTCVPFLIWSAGPFLDDVLWFNLGRTEPLMPTSGLGLPAVAPDVFHGPLLGASTLAGMVLAFAVVPWLAARLRSLAWVGPLTALGLVGLLLPARTFQINYLVLIVMAATTGWWAVRHPGTPSTLQATSPSVQLRPSTRVESLGAVAPGPGHGR